MLSTLDIRSFLDLTVSLGSLTDDLRIEADRLGTVLWNSVASCQNAILKQGDLQCHRTLCDPLCAIS